MQKSSFKTVLKRKKNKASSAGGNKSAAAAKSKRREEKRRRRKAQRSKPHTMVLAKLPKIQLLEIPEVPLELDIPV